MVSLTGMLTPATRHSDGRQSNAIAKPLDNVGELKRRAYVLAGKIRKLPDEDPAVALVIPISPAGQGGVHGIAIEHITRSPTRQGPHGSSRLHPRGQRVGNYRDRRGGHTPLIQHGADGESAAGAA
jgi:hypothetical protein